MRVLKLSVIGPISILAFWIMSTNYPDAKLVYFQMTKQNETNLNESLDTWGSVTTF